MSHSRQRAPMRATRAAMFAAVCVALAAMGHSSMSGMDIPFGWILGAFAVTAGLAWPATGRRCGPAGISASLLAAQAALHVAFSVSGPMPMPLPLGTPKQPPGPHPHGPGTMSHDPVTADTMPGTLPGGMTGGTPDALAGSLPGGMPDAVSGAMPGTLPGGTTAGSSDALAGSLPGGMPDAVSGAMPEAMAGSMHGAMPDMMHGAMPGPMPGGMSGALPGGMPDVMAGMPGTLPGGMADAVAGAVPGPMGHVGGTAAGAMARAMGDAAAGAMADMAGHGGAGMGDMAGHGVAHLVAMAGHGGVGMIAAHLLAGLLCALWLAWGEAAVFRLAAALGATALLAARPLARALALVRTRVALVPAPPAHCPPYERPRRLRGAVHAHTAVRRGPPGWGISTRTTAPGRPARA